MVCLYRQIVRSNFDLVVVVVADSVEIGGNVGLEVDLTVAAAGVRARSGLEDSDSFLWFPS